MPYGKSFGFPEEPEILYGKSYGFPKEPEILYDKNFSFPKEPEMPYDKSLHEPETPEASGGIRQASGKAPAGILALEAKVLKT